MDGFLAVVTSDAFIIACEAIVAAVMLVFVILLSGQKKTYLQNLEEEQKKEQNEKLDNLLKNTGRKLD